MMMSAMRTMQPYPASLERSAPTKRQKIIVCRALHLFGFTSTISRFGKRFRVAVQFDHFLVFCSSCRAVGTSCCLPIGWQQLGVAFPPGCCTSREIEAVVVGGCMVRV